MTRKCFLRRVNKTKTCWIWVGGRDSDGYGIVRDNGKSRRAHRVAFELFKGVITKPLVCHTCDNPWCVRPAHLFVGTHSDNQLDMGRKGRHRLQTHPEEAVWRGGLGSRNGRAKLTEADIPAIRQRLHAGEKQSDIANAFSVSQRVISLIFQRRAWMHVEEAE